MLRYYLHLKLGHHGPTKMNEHVDYHVPEIQYEYLTLPNGPSITITSKNISILY